MKNYRFNYGFLAEWQKANKGIISRDEILRGLGTTNTGSLAKWKRGEIAMPIESLLRLCNTFDIDLSYFFFDDSQPAELQLAQSKPDCQIKPLGSYGRKEEVEERKESVMPVQQYELPTDVSEEEKIIAEESIKQEKIIDYYRREFERKVSEIRQEHKDAILMLSQNIAELKMSVDNLIDSININRK